MQRGVEDAMFSTLRVDDDQESLTQFVHRCRARGVTSQQLLDSLLKNEPMTTGKNRRRAKDRGSCSLRTAPGVGRIQLGTDSEHNRRMRWWIRSPTGTPATRVPPIHGAAGWLLRHWDRADLAKKVDQTPLPYSTDREWFTLEVKTKVEGLLGPVDTRLLLYVCRLPCRQTMRSVHPRMSRTEAPARTGIPSRSRAPSPCSIANSRSRR